MVYIYIYIYYFCCGLFYILSYGGPRSNITCAAISMSKDAIIPWMDEIRYLGVYCTISVVYMFA